MKWPDVLLAPVQCEFKAQYGFGRWQSSAEGALRVVVLAPVVKAVWGRWRSMDS